MKNWLKLLYASLACLIATLAVAYLIVSFVGCTAPVIPKGAVQVGSTTQPFMTMPTTQPMVSVVFQPGSVNAVVPEVVIPKGMVTTEWTNTVSIGSKTMWAILIVLVVLPSPVHLLWNWIKDRNKNS